MDLNEARELVGDERLWPKVRDAFLASGEFKVYPKGDLRRLEFVDPSVRSQIDLWVEGLSRADEWKTVLAGAQVKELKAAYPGVYPDVFRYAPYFKRFGADGIKDNSEALTLLLKLKFPEVYDLCFC